MKICGSVEVDVTGGIRSRGKEIERCGGLRECSHYAYMTAITSCVVKQTPDAFRKECQTHCVTEIIVVMARQLNARNNRAMHAGPGAPSGVRAAPPPRVYGRLFPYPKE